MSEDRKLLEDAARAAGMRVVGWNDTQGEDVAVLEDQSFWQPLHVNRITDCMGDALRLAVRLGLIVDTHGMHTRVQLPYEGEALCHEPHGADPYAATRRAIVRAAAAMAPTPTEDAR